jgi:hypothetical protein
MIAMKVPLWLKVAWTVWVIVWVPLYWKQYGLQNFLFFCDLGNFFIMLALWLESPLIFSWQAAGLLLFQTLFTIRPGYCLHYCLAHLRRHGIHVRSQPVFIHSPA